MDMKRTFFLVASTFALTLCAQNASTMDVGYCSDESTGAIGLTDKGLNVAAVFFDEDFLAQYAGNEVTALLVQLGASFGSEGSVFLTDDLGESVPMRYDAEYDIPDFDFVPCYKWIEVPLPTPLTIDPARPFYAGIRILPYASAPYYGCYQFAVDQSEQGAAHCFIYDDAKHRWGRITDYSYEEEEGNPNFLVKLRVKGSALPADDVVVSDLKCVDYLRTGETAACSFVVTNVAANDVTEFDAELLLDGAMAETQHVELQAPLKTKESTTCRFEHFSFAHEGTHKIEVRVANLNGVADSHPENNTVEREVSVIDRYYDRKVLVEAFTTMSCANCPGAHERQDVAFEGVENVVRVDHHSGFGTDVLTTNADRDFLWFYANGGTTYAPGMMFDRAMVDDFFDPQRSPGEEHSPVIGPGEAENMLFIFKHLEQQPAYVDVNIDGVYETESRELTVNVSGETIAKLMVENPTLNVWLTESGLSAADDRRYGQMTASGQLDMKFVHNNVMRTTMTGSWGEPMSQEVAPYSFSYSVKLDKSWRPENMEVVAFVANHDSTKPDNCRVMNANSVGLAELIRADGIVPVAAESVAPCVFDLQGRRVSSTTRGPKIVDGKLVM